MTMSNNKKYVIYILKYLGVALIAGSVVHVGTLNNGTERYIVLGIIGLIIMIIGHMIEAKDTGEKINFRYFAMVTTLSLATGFFSGGIQHYLDNPVYASYLLAVGFLVSYIIFYIKDGIRIKGGDILIVCVTVSLIVFLSTLFEQKTYTQVESGGSEVHVETGAHSH